MSNSVLSPYEFFFLNIDLITKVFKLLSFIAFFFSKIDFFHSKLVNGVQSPTVQAPLEEGTRWADEEIADLSNSLTESVREVVREIAPKIVREIIKEEIDKIKKL